jgi:ring-1,2-phenylacetyl-CoA epoxidase subunit PaaE
LALEYHELKITSIEPTAQNAVCVTFQVPAEHRTKFEFIPGQHLTLRHRIKDEKLRRFYSICTPQAGSEIRIGVRQIEDGRFSEFLNKEARVGDKIEVLAPRGHFRLAADTAGKHIIAFAAGSGVTPVYSILHNHLMRDPHSTAVLVYGNQMTKSIMLCSDLNDLKDQYLDRFQMIHLLSREQQDIEQLNGRIDQKSITKIIESGLVNPKDASQIFVCGPANMIDEVELTLSEHGVDPDLVSIERFTALGSDAPVKVDQQTKKVVEDGVKVSFVQDGIEKEFSFSDPNDTVLSAAEKAGFELPFSCAGGMCATCRCKLVEGEVQMDVNYALEPWELEAGFVLACQSRPKSRQLRLDFDAT